MKTKILHGSAIFLILQTGLLHMVFSQHAYDEAAYLGYLFIFNFLGAILAAYGVYRNKTWGWGLGAAVAAGSIAGYIWSRTLGLPGTDVEEWLFLPAVLAAGLEALFLLVLLARPWRLESPFGEEKPKSLFGHLASASSVMLFVVITGAAFAWGDPSGHGDHGETASLEEILSAPAISSAEFEETYGMRVTLAGISLLDSIVDVRVKVTDPEKARELLEGASALLVDEKSLVLAPHKHGHGSLKPGQIYVMFFPTMNNTVQAGSQISLVFGHLRVEPVTAK